MPADIRDALLGELFTSPKAVIAGVANGLILNVTALCMHAGEVFAAFIVLDVIIVTMRLFYVLKAFRCAERGLPTPTDQYLLSASLWCGLQGAMAFAAVQTNALVLQFLAATTVMALVGPICARNYAAPRYALMLVGLCVAPFVCRASTTGDPWRLVLILQSPLFLYGVIATIARFQEMAVSVLTAEKESYDRARTDSLTGLLNRFGLMEMLGLHYTRKSERFVLFYLDLDGFKPINDNFGHQAGDRILRAVAQRLRTAIRPGDILSRVGGDEFVIVAPDMPSSEAAAYAEAIIHRIAGEQYLMESFGPVQVGISVGFACTPEDGFPGEELHRKADEALYQAKSAGKGVYRRYGSLEIKPCSYETQGGSIVTT